MDYSIFVKSYKASNNKDEFVKKHITTKYLGYAKKMALAKNVARVSSHVIDQNGNAGEYRRDTMAQFFHTQINIISQYTDVEIPSEAVIEAYDALSECGALGDIFRIISDGEIEMIKSMVQMAMDDIYINEADVGAVLSAKLEAFRLVADTAMSALEVVASAQKE